MAEARKVIVYIDGGNTYRALFTQKNDSNGTLLSALVPKGSKFNYKKFVDFLAVNNTLEGMKYHVGVVRNYDHTPKSEKMVRDQQKFLAKLENQGFIIERGKIVYDHKIREKGVDVKLAIDLVIDGIEEKYDTAILVSSDTDLIPAIRYVQSKGKRVEYIGFSNQNSIALIKECLDQRILAATDIRPFIHE